MRHLKGRQGRFLLTTVGGWVAARAWLLWPAAPVAIGGALVTAAWLRDALPPPTPQPAASFRPAPAVRPIRPTRHAIPAAEATVPFDRLSPSRAGHRLLGVFEDGYGAGTSRLLRYARYDSAPRQADAPPSQPVSPPAAPPGTPPARATGRIEGEAYLFLRPGSGRAALAPSGSLGGSQVAARLAVPIGGTRLAAAARLYAPLRTAGAEAAVGFDWRPLPGVPVRLSIERRIGLDHAGRNAWSAYAAGGFTRALPQRLLLDGYAQAGVVGAARRDLFADGAVRLGRRVDAAGLELVAGAGAWGAAQPGVARFDVGPRLAASLPVERHRLSFAVEGRFRLAGQAAPGSGAAVTLAADF